MAACLPRVCQRPISRAHWPRNHAGKRFKLTAPLGDPKSLKALSHATQSRACSLEWPVPVGPSARTVPTRWSHMWSCPPAWGASPRSRIPCTSRTRSTRGRSRTIGVRSCEFGRALTPREVGRGSVYDWAGVTCPACLAPSAPVGGPRRPARTRTLRRLAHYLGRN